MLDPFLLFKLSIALFVTDVIFCCLFNDRFSSYNKVVTMISSIFTYSAMILFTISIFLGVWFWVFDKL